LEDNKMKPARNIIRELVEEVLEEMTATGAVAGYSTPNAFGKNPNKKKDAARSMPGGEVVGDIDTDATTVGENESMVIRRSLEESFKPKDKVILTKDVLDGQHKLEAGRCGKIIAVHPNGEIDLDVGSPSVWIVQATDIRLASDPIHEGRSRYRNFKDSDLMKNHAKVSYGIREAKKMLGEVEYLLNLCERLKTEGGIATNSLWKRTQPDMKEIHKRLKAIAGRIHNMKK
jgi:hypothetical protein